MKIEIQREVIANSVFVKRPMNRTLEVDLLTLVEIQELNCPRQRILEIEVRCRGKTQRFPYDVL